MKHDPVLELLLEAHLAVVKLMSGLVNWWVKNDLSYHGFAREVSYAVPVLLIGRIETGSEANGPQRH